MNWTTLFIASLFTLLCPPWLARGQQVRVEDAASAVLAADLYKRLPISDSDRTTLRDAIKARNYTRAEALLAGEIERNPKSQLLLTTVGGIFFLDGKYKERRVTRAGVRQGVLEEKRAVARRAEEGEAVNAAIRAQELRRYRAAASTPERCEALRS